MQADGASGKRSSQFCIYFYRPSYSWKMLREGSCAVGAGMMCRIKKNIQDVYFVSNYN